MKTKNNKQGFTLLELLVVVLIIGILAAIALPQYFKAVERARAAEALSLFGTIAGAQQRYYLLKGSFTGSYGDLDIDFEGATGGSLTTKSFGVSIASSSTAVATRNGGRYSGYRLTKDFETGEITCGNGPQICKVLGFRVVPREE